MGMLEVVTRGVIANSILSIRWSYMYFLTAGLFLYQMTPLTFVRLLNAKVSYTVYVGLSS